MKGSQRSFQVPARRIRRLGIVQQEVDLGAAALGRGHAEEAVTFFQSALSKLDVHQPFYDHLVHNLLLSYSLLIEQQLKSGDIQTALGFLTAALRLEICGEMAGDPTFLKRFAEGFQGIGIAFFKRNFAGESLLCSRKAISIYSAPGSYVNLTNALTASGQPAVLSDFTTEITPEQLGRHIFIACVPKSASTFLKNLLVGLTGYKDLFAVYAAGQNEHDLYLPTILESAHLDTVTQQHCRASDANVQMMQAFAIRPVVLVRNIFDSVMSLLDFYNKGAFQTSYFRADFMSLDDDLKIDLLIDNLVPWYLQFVASWDLAEKQKRLEVMWLSYEDLVRDKPASVMKVLNFYGLGAPLRGIEDRIRDTESGKCDNRFNKGVPGRGTTGLSERQKDRIRSFARYFPSADLGRIGL